MEIWEKALKLGVLLTIFSINSYAAPQEVVKPKINSIGFWSAKWYINYDELKNGTNLLKEELFVDGNSDRIVTIGTEEKRGFPLNGTYDVNSCHKAYVVVYDKSHNVVTKSDTFNFGKISKCDDYVPPSDSTNPVITLVGVNPQVVTKGQAYKELGAIALDNRDGELTNKITIDSSAVDTSTVGESTVTYDVVDASGNDAITVTRIVKVVAEDFEGELEIHSMNFFKGKWHIRYQDLKPIASLKKEILFVDGNEVRTVAGGLKSNDDRGFSFLGDYAQDACHKAYIVAYDNDDNNLSQSDVFEFGDVSKCGGDKGIVPEAPQHLNLNNVYDIKFDDTSTNEQGFHLYNDGKLIKTIGANDGTGVVSTELYSDNLLEPGSILNLVVKAFNKAGESSESNRVVQYHYEADGSDLNRYIRKTTKEGLYSFNDSYSNGHMSGSHIKFFYIKNGIITFIKMLEVESETSRGYGRSESISIAHDRAYRTNYTNSETEDSSTYVTIYNISDLSNIFRIMDKYCTNGVLTDYSKWLDDSNSWISIYDKEVEDKGYSCDHEFLDINLTKGLVSHYEFEGNAKDSSGNGNDGTAKNGVTFSQDGVLGKSALFSDTKEIRIEVPDSNSLDTHDRLSLSIWVNPSDRRNSVLVQKYYSSEQWAGGEYSLGLSAEGKVGFTIANYDSTKVNDYLAGEQIPLNQWSYITASFDNGKMKLYINGTLVAEKISSITQITTKEYSYDGIHVGNIVYNNYNDAWFVGKMDDLRIYNRALNEAEIAELYKMGEGKIDNDANSSFAVLSYNDSNTYSKNYSDVTSREVSSLNKWSETSKEFSFNGNMMIDLGLHSEDSTLVDAHKNKNNMWLESWSTDEGYMLLEFKDKDNNVLHTFEYRKPIGYNSAYIALDGNKHNGSNAQYQIDIHGYIYIKDNKLEYDGEYRIYQGRAWDGLADKTWILSNYDKIKTVKISIGVKGMHDFSGIPLYVEY